MSDSNIKDERTVSATKHGDAVDTKPPVDEGTVSTSKDGDGGKSFAWGADVGSTEHQVSINIDDPRGLKDEPAFEVVDDTPSAGGDTIKVTFKGEPREYTMDAARTMLSQFLNQGNRTEDLKMVDNITQQYGLNSPQQVLQLAAVGARAVQDQMRHNATANQPTPTQPVADPNTPTQPTPNGANMDEAAIDRELSSFEETNGISMTPAMRENFRSILKHGGQVEAMAGALPQMAEQLAGQQQRVQAQEEANARQATNTVAKAKAVELNIDTPEHAEGFGQFVQSLEVLQPGVTKAIMVDPKRMAAAVEMYAMNAKGLKAANTQKELSQQVQNDAARAGGDFGVVSSGGGNSKSQDFNSKMMDVL